MERVLDALLLEHPDALLVGPRFGDGDLAEELALPWSNERVVVRGARRKAHLHAPLYARRLAPVRLDVDVVLALANIGWGVHAGAAPGARRVVYLAGLPRPLYVEYERYASRQPRPTRLLGPALLPALRRWYVRTMRRADRLVTISQYSARRVGEVVGRPLEVVHPPVRTAFFTPSTASRRHVLVVGRLVPHKRIEVVLEAFRGLDRQLVVAGGGDELGRLRALAPPNATLLGRVSDEELRELYRASEALVCPSVEEFGVVVAEALACGVPVVAPRDGGALEIVEDGRTGVLVDRVEPRELVAALDAVRALAPPPGACRASVERFDERRFTERLGAILAEERALAAAARLAPAAPRPAVGAPASPVGEPSSGG